MHSAQMNNRFFYTTRKSQVNGLDMKLQFCNMVLSLTTVLRPKREYDHINDCFCFLKNIYKAKS